MPQQIDDEGPPKPKSAAVSERESPRQKGLDSSRLSMAFDRGRHSEDRGHGKGNHSCARQELARWPFGMHHGSGQIGAIRNHAPLPECSYVNRTSSTLTAIIIFTGLFGSCTHLIGLCMRPELIQNT